MIKILTIPSDNPKHTTQWPMHIWFDECGISGMHGHSGMSNMINLHVMYDDMVWDVDDAARRYFINDLAIPYLLQEDYIKEDDDGFYYPTKKLKDYM